MDHVKRNAVVQGCAQRFKEKQTWRQGLPAIFKRIAK